MRGGRRLERTRSNDWATHDPAGPLGSSPSMPTSWPDPSPPELTVLHTAAVRRHQGRARRQQIRGTGDLHCRIISRPTTPDPPARSSYLHDLTPCCFSSSRSPWCRLEEN